MIKQLLLISALLAIVPATYAADAYVIRFHADGLSYQCHYASWNDDVLFYNTNGAAASVIFLGISNGDLMPGSARTLVLPPQQLLSLRENQQNARWGPTEVGSGGVWVVHLDVPAGVVVESRDEVSDATNCHQEQFFARGPVAKVSMPVFRQLVPAGTRQVLLGTDLVAPGSRQNVIIYNGGDRPASAQIEIRRGCDEELVDSRTVTIPANTTLQFGGFSNGTNGASCPGPLPPHAQPYVRYTTVTVDQPSLVVVSTLTETQQPTTGNVTPIIELAVSVNSVF